MHLEFGKRKHDGLVDAAGGDDFEEVWIVTAGDDDVCPECEDLEAEGPYDIDVAEDLIPAHPNCRCVFIPDDSAHDGLADDWDEEKHPRDPHGRWGEGGAGGGEKTVDEALAYLHAQEVVGIDGQPRPGGGGGGARVPFPEASKAEVKDIDKHISFDQHNLPEREVALKDLHGIQPSVSRGKVEGLLKSGLHEGKGDDKPLAVERGGKVILWDGHHRATAASLLGKTHITVRMAKTK